MKLTARSKRRTLRESRDKGRATVINVVLFNYTLLILLLAVFTSALCLSAFLVSRKNSLGFASLAFLFYFFDCAWVAQEAMMGQVHPTLPLYSVLQTGCVLVTGTGILTSFWLAVCSYLYEYRKRVWLIPPLVFAGLSFISLLLPDTLPKGFIFYAWRMVFFAFSLLFLAYHFVMSNETDRLRLKRHRVFYALAWIGCLAVVGQDLVCFFVLDDATLTALAPFGLPERSYAENFLAIVCAVSALLSSVKALAIRFQEGLNIKEDTPEATIERQHQDIRENLQFYAERYALTSREREVLQYVLEGLDNQNIASELQLSVNTVKVHVHNILHKTEQASRQDLIRDFWKN